MPSGAFPSQPSDVAVVLFTSGSTGIPKAAAPHAARPRLEGLTHGRVHGLGPADAVLMPAPMAHVSGLLNGVLVPAQPACASVMVRRFDPEQALRTGRRGAGHLHGGPADLLLAMARALAEGPAPTSPAPPGVHRRRVGEHRPSSRTTARTFGCRVKRTYGSTEAPTVTTGTDDDPSSEPATPTDVPRASRDSASRPETGRGCGTGMPGELWMRGPSMFAGYADAAQTGTVITPGRWYRTGDLAMVDATAGCGSSAASRTSSSGRREHLGLGSRGSASRPTPTSITPGRGRLSRPPVGERVAAFVESTAPFDLEECRGGSPSAAGRPCSRRPRRSNGWTTCRSWPRASPTGPPCRGEPPHPDRVAAAVPDAALRRRPALAFGPCLVAT